MKSVNFELSFQQLPKFLDFAKFHPSKIQSGQTLNLRQIFTATENFVLCRSFAKLHPSHDLSGQKCQFWAKFPIDMTKNVRILPNFILRRALVVKNVTAIENFWILPTFIFRMSWMVKNVSFELNFWQESKFHHWQVKGGQTLDFKLNLQRDWKYLKNIKISLFHQILSFSGPEWSKFSILSQIFNATQIFGFCQISSFVGPEWSKMSILSQILNLT